MSHLKSLRWLLVSGLFFGCAGYAAATQIDEIDTLDVEYSAILSPLAGRARHPLNPPSDIVSKFGPRLLRDGTFNLHFGIDYRAPEGRLVRAVEAGEIVTIDYDSVPGQQKGGHYISVRGQDARFSYMHLFHDRPALPVTACDHPGVINDCQIQGVYHRIQLLKVAGHRTVVFWRDPRTIVKALAAQEGLPVPLGTCSQLVLKPNAREKYPRCFTRNRVRQGEVIATSGTSSGSLGNPVEPHLHVQVNGGADNPLYYIERPSFDYHVAGIRVTYLNGERVPDATLLRRRSPALIVATVSNPQLKSHDLNRLDISVPPQHRPQSPAGLVSFRWNGHPGEGSFNSSLRIDATDLKRTGVKPLGTPMRDQFAFEFDYADDQAIPAGSYIARVQGWTVLNSTQTPDVDDQSTVVRISDCPCLLTVQGLRELGHPRPDSRCVIDGNFILVTTDPPDHEVVLEFDPEDDMACSRGIEGQPDIESRPLRSRKEFLSCRYDLFTAARALGIPGCPVP